MRFAIFTIGLFFLLAINFTNGWQKWTHNQSNVVLSKQAVQIPSDCFDLDNRVLTANLTLQNRWRFLCGQPLISIPEPKPMDIYTLAIDYLRQGNVERAIDLFQEIGVSLHIILSLRIEPEYRGDHVKLTHLVMVASQLPFYRESGNNPYRHILAAIDDYLDWDLPIQAAELHELIAYHEPPSELRYWLSVAEAARLRGEIDKANDVYVEAKQTWPDELVLHQRHGSLLLRENRWADAIKAGQEWLTVDPEDGRAMYQIGQAYYRSGEYDEAELWLNQALIRLIVNASNRIAIENMLLDIAEQKNK